MFKKENAIPWNELKIENEIGEGAYAIVYVGKWKGKTVAVKEMKMDILDEQNVKVIIAQICWFPLIVFLLFLLFLEGFCR